MKYIVEYTVIKDGIKKTEAGSWEAKNDEEAREDYKSFRQKCSALSGVSSSSSCFIPEGCFRIDAEEVRTKIA